MHPRPRLALFALAALAVAVVLGRSGTPGGVDPAAAPAAAIATQPVPLFADAQVGTGDGGSSGGVEVAPSGPDELPGPGAWVGTATSNRVRIWSRPGAGGSVRETIDASNPWDQQLAFPVVRAQLEANGTAWYRIMLGVEPNGSTGWIRASEVTLERSTDRVVVDLSAHTLQHRRGGEVIHRFRVGIGAGNTPTTPGRFFVWASLLPADPNGPYGSYLLGLSGFSDVLQSWPGGGRLAIHGTDDPTDRGADVSHGCVRVFNPQMDRLRDVPMGTVVVIRR